MKTFFAALQYVLTVITICLCLSTPAFAQGNLGGVTGTVSDASGASVCCCAALRSFQSSLLSSTLLILAGLAGFGLTAGSLPGVPTPGKPAACELNPMIDAEAANMVNTDNSPAIRLRDFLLRRVEVSPREGALSVLRPAFLCEFGVSAMLIRRAWQDRR